MGESCVYICVCKGITEDQLRKQVKQGKSPREILGSLGVGDDCGVCVLAALSKLQTFSGEAAKDQKKAKVIKV